MKEQKSEIVIRKVSPADAEELRNIYAPYVEDTAISFEYEVPSVEEFEARIRKTLQKYPYLAAEKNGEILGYAYTSPFVGRAAYDWAVGTSIYLKKGQEKQGIGKRLYDALEAVSRAQNICSMYACIGYPEQEDTHLTNNSAAFHEHIGFTQVGMFHRCGYKFGTWYHMIWMEKQIAAHPEKPEAVIPFPELDRALFDSLGIR